MRTKQIPPPQGQIPPPHHHPAGPSIIPPNYRHMNFQPQQQIHPGPPPHATQHFHVRPPLPQIPRPPVGNEEIRRYAPR